jgi:hypothetical protein
LDFWNGFCERQGFGIRVSADHSSTPFFFGEGMGNRFMWWPSVHFFLESGASQGQNRKRPL